jgi:hypothetical protein
LGQKELVSAEQQQCTRRSSALATCVARSAPRCNQRRYDHDAPSDGDITDNTHLPQVLVQLRRLRRKVLRDAIEVHLAKFLRIVALVKRYELVLEDNRTVL